jgi:hypothetical protein
MVKNSKYLIMLIGLVVTLNASAQGNGRFSPVQRDLEVTRVTLETFFKKWDGNMMLNQFKDVQADYKKGLGITISMSADNAEIFMSVHNGNFQNADNLILDTFFSDDMIALQKERLVDALKAFFDTYKSYLPKLESGEKVLIAFDVKDRIKKEKSGKQLEPSPLSHKRTYQLEAEISASDLENYKSGSMSVDAFNSNMKINYSNK